MNDDDFRILIAVHRPRYRSRAERAASVPGWQVRSLLNKEDPIGPLNKKPRLHALVISDDFGRQTDLRILRAAQRFRPAGLRIIGLFEGPESAESARGLCDAALVPPWRTADLRAIVERFFAEATGHRIEAPPDVSHLSEGGI